MSQDLDPRIYQIALARIPKVGAVLGKTLVAYCGGVDAVFQQKKAHLLKIPGIGEQHAKSILEARPLTLAERDLKYYQNKDIKLTFYLDQDYPARLKNYEDAPLLLFSQGAFNPNPARTISIVGTRKPSIQGTRQCTQLINDMKGFGAQIISGLAYGIDALVHRTANELNMENLAIMGTGSDAIYPAVHRELANRIKKNGALISEYPIKMRADKENFPRRNRVIAALSDVVIVIESARKGGSLITAEFGNQYFKDVFAFPGRINDVSAQGCNALIKQNKAHLLESAKDIAYIMRWENDPKPVSNQTALFVSLDEEEQAIYNHLKEKKTASLDRMHHELKMPLSLLSSRLLSLEFNGLIKTRPGKRFTII